MDWTSLDTGAAGEDMGCGEPTNLKPEPTEDDFSLDGMTDSLHENTNLASPVDVAPVADKAKRPRGRPRKHPLAAIPSANKVGKGRSKTGCITCRKRKKKCDEAKPRCLNCEKNAVVCEGYHEKHIWRSGRDRRSEEDREILPTFILPSIINGVSTLEDRIFWRHYMDRLSGVLTVENEHRNAFKDMLHQLALRHHGLMHSILALASKHIDYETPYGAKLIRDNPATSLLALQTRSAFHQAEATRIFGEDLLRQPDENHPDYSTILNARYGQMLCRLVQTMVEGDVHGEHRLHLQTYQRLVEVSPPRDEAFFGFIAEFFQYHIYADALLHRSQDSSIAVPVSPYLSRTEMPSSDCGRASTVLSSLSTPRLFGVTDGLFDLLAEITDIRQKVRSNIISGVDPVVDYSSLHRAVDIDNAIREWAPHCPPGDSRERVGQLYKQVLWIYLYRTIYPPEQAPTMYKLHRRSSVPILSRRASFNPSYTKAADDHEPRSTPPRSVGSRSPQPTSQSMFAPRPKDHASNLPRRSNTSSSGYWAGGQAPYQPHTGAAHLAPRRASTTNLSHMPQPEVRCSPPSSPVNTMPTHASPSMLTSSTTPAPPSPHSSTSHRTGQNAAHAQLAPPEQTQPTSSTYLPPSPTSPPPTDTRVTSAVEAALTLIESVSPSDPAQRLLLIPCMVVGAACGDDEKRKERIRQALRTVKGYTGMGNINRVSRVLEECWADFGGGEGGGSGGGEEGWKSWDWTGVGEGLGWDFLVG